MDQFSHAPVRAGDVLANKYRVERVIGMGGMGIVVAARHVELDQPVALKFLLPGAVDSEEMVSRFVNEGRAVVKLKSEHVAKVLDVGRLDNGAPYIVMELLVGEDLGAVMRERRTLSVEDAAGFVLQACEAVGEAHASKIIHRDLKPQNLFLTTGLDGEPLVKVLDFGISKSLTPTSGDGGAPMTLTRTHSMLGSPLYMSPEQMRSSKRADERSDIWSFGVILFELLTGRVPFEADNVPELVFKMAENEAPSVLTLRPDVPPALAAAVQRCLQKEPDKRFATLADLAMELEPFASPRERGIAARIGVMLGTMQPRARAMSFSDVSGAKSAPAIAVSDAWGATQSADASAPAAKGKAAASGALRIALGAVVVVGLGVFAFAFTRSRMTHDQVDHAAAAGTGVPAQSTGVPAQASGAAPLASPSALASTTLPAPSAVAVPSASASALTPSAQGAPLSPRPGARAGKVGTGAPGGGAPSAAAPSVAPSPSARGGFIQVRE